MQALKASLPRQRTRMSPSVLFSSHSPEQCGCFQERLQPSHLPAEVKKNASDAPAFTEILIKVRLIAVAIASFLQRTGQHHQVWLPTCFQLIQGSMQDSLHNRQNINWSYQSRQFPQLEIKTNKTKQTKILSESSTVVGFFSLPKIQLPCHQAQEHRACSCLKSAAVIRIILRLNNTCWNAVYRKWAIYFIIQILNPFNMPPKKMSDLENCKKKELRRGQGILKKFRQIKKGQIKQL